MEPQNGHKTDGSSLSESIKAKTNMAPKWANKKMRVVHKGPSFRSWPRNWQQMIVVYKGPSFRFHVSFPECSPISSAKLFRIPIRCMFRVIMRYRRLPKLGIWASGFLASVGFAVGGPSYSNFLASTVGYAKFKANGKLQTSWLPGLVLMERVELSILGGERRRYPMWRNESLQPNHFRDLVEAAV